MALMSLMGGDNTEFGGDTSAQYGDMSSSQDYRIDNLYQPDSAFYTGMNYLTGGSGGISAFNAAMGMGDGVDARGWNMKNMDAASGVASGLGSDWLEKGLKWFDEQKDSTKGAMITLGGSFLKGLFSYGDTQRALKIQQQRADADTSTAQTSANALQQKINAGNAIGQTSFGKSTKKPVFVNKLAERQQRSGYGA